MTNCASVRKLSSIFAFSFRYTYYIHNFKGVAKLTNKQLRLSTAAILATSVVAAALPATIAEAATYKDVPKSSHYYEAIFELTERGLIQGYADKTFKPNAKITRGHIATILSRMLDLEPDKSVKFSDLPNSHAFYDVASAVVSAGLMTTHSGNKFDSKQYLTRYEYAEILAKAFELKAITNKVPFTDVSANDQSKIQAVYDHGIMTGKTAKKFDGFSTLTRGQAALTLYRTIQMQEQEQQEPPKEPAMTKETVSISLVTASYILTEDDEIYKIPSALASIINATNASALKDAEVEIELTDGVWTGIDKLTLNVEGSTYAEKILNGQGQSYSFPIVLNGTNIRLQNMTIDNVIIGENATYQASLNNVKVKKQVELEDGFTSSFALRFVKSTVPYAVINRDNTTIESSNAIPQLFLDEEAYDVTLNSAVGQLQLVRGGYVTLTGSGTVDKLLVPVETDLYLNNSGYVKELVVSDADSWIRLGSKVSIGTATIPTHADYEDVLSYSGNIKSLVAKVKYPNSTLNLLSNTIVKPTKEEIAYQNALNNVIKTYESSLNATTMAIRTSFSTIPVSLKELAFDQVITLLDSSLNVETIPVVIKRGGIEVFNGNIDVSRLRSGVSIQSLTGLPLTLANFTSNGEATYSISFNTDVEFTIRSSVYVNGVWKKATEKKINAGYNDRYTNALTAAFSDYTVDTNLNALTAKVKFNTIDAMVKDAKVDHYIKLKDNVTDVTTLPLTVKKGQTTIFSGDVAVNTLKNGVYVSNLPNAVKETLGNFSNNSNNEYSFTVGTTKELEFETRLYVGGVQKGATKSTKVNSGASAAISALEVPFTVTAPDSTSIKVNLDAIGTVSNLIKNTALDYQVKLINAQVNHSDLIELQVKYNGVDHKLLVEQSELEKGISLIQSLNAGQEVAPLTLANLTDGESVEVKVISPMKGDIEVVPLVGGTVKGTPSSVAIEKAASLGSVSKTVSASSSSIDTSTIDAFSVGTSDNGLQVKTKFAAGVASSTHKDKYLDARLKVTNGLYGFKDDKKYSVSVYYGGNKVVGFKQITVADLRDGILLSKVIGSSPVKISDHTQREDTWDIVVEDLSDTPLDITVDLIATDNAASNPNEVIVATVDQTVNSTLSDKFASSVQDFKLTRTGNRLDAEAQFTSTPFTGDSKHNVDYVLLPVDASTVTKNYTASRIGYGYGSSVDVYKSNVTFTPANFIKGISTLGYIFERINATGIGPSYMELESLAGTKGNWAFEFTTSVPKMKAYFLVDAYIVKEAVETP